MKKAWKKTALSLLMCLSLVLSMFLTAFATGAEGVEPNGEEIQITAEGENIVQIEQIEKGVSELGETEADELVDTGENDEAPSDEGSEEFFSEQIMLYSSEEISLFSAEGFAGAGTQASPYQISTAEELKKLAALVNSEDTAAMYGGAHYALTNDIDLTGIEWDMPIGTPSHPFSGSFDGCGYAIKNISLTYGTLTSSVGLFNYIENSEIKNLQLKNHKLSIDLVPEKGSGVFVGMIASVAIDSSVENCVVDGEILVRGGNTDAHGALIGYADNVTVRNCVYIQRSAERSQMDCFAGTAKNSSFSQLLGYWVEGSNYNTTPDDIVAENIASTIDKDSVYVSLKRVYSSKKVTLVDHADAVSGRLLWLMGKSAGSGEEYVQSELCPTVAGAGETAQTAAEQKFKAASGSVVELVFKAANGIAITPFDYDDGSKSVYPIAGGSITVTSETVGFIIKNSVGSLSGSDNTYTISAADDTEYIYGTETDFNRSDSSWYSESETELTITTPAQLYSLAEMVNAGNGFEGKTVKLGGDIVLSLIVGEGVGSWLPIGRAVAPFSGTFDGNGHLVTGLYYNSSVAESDIGLFGYIKNANVKNMTVSGKIVCENTGNVGLAIGTMENSTVESIKNMSGSSVEGTHHVGGIAGYAAGDTNTVDGCENNAAVKGGAGYQMPGSMPWDKAYTDAAGGVVGGTLYNKGGITIKNCVNNAALETAAGAVGGIVGCVNNAEILRCVNNGAITSTAGNLACNAVGGIAAYPYGKLTLSDCIATAKVTGNKSGVIAGYIQKTASVVKNCVYYPAETGGEQTALPVYDSSSKAFTLSNCFFLKGWGIETAGATATEAEEFKKPSMLTKLGNEWTLKEGAAYPTLAEAGAAAGYAKLTIYKPLELIGAVDKDGAAIADITVDEENETLGYKSYVFAVGSVVKFKNADNKAMDETMLCGNTALAVEGEEGVWSVTVSEAAALKIESAYNWYTNNPETAEFEISTIEQLKAFRNLVNGDDEENNPSKKDGAVVPFDFEGKTVKLTADIELNTGDDKEAWEQWVPIGVYTDTVKRPFKGTFDGGGHKISKLFINNAEADNQALFGYIAGGENGGYIVRSLTVEGEVTARDNAALIAAYGEFEKKYNYVVYESAANGSVTGVNNVGLAAGRCVATDPAATIYFQNNTIKGSVIAAGVKTGEGDEEKLVGGNNAGGIVGCVTFDEKFTQAELSGKHIDIQGNSFIGSVKGCDNVGGIVGYTRGGNISKCNVLTDDKNTLDDVSDDIKSSVSGANNVGGMAGYIELYYNYAYSSGKNEATVTGTGDNVGGFAGHLVAFGSAAAGVNSAEEYNNGSVAGVNNVGGLFGFVELKGDKTRGAKRNYINKAAVMGLSNVGGIIGKWSAELAANTPNFAEVYSLGNVEVLAGEDGSKANSFGSVVGQIELPAAEDGSEAKKLLALDGAFAKAAFAPAEVELKTTNSKDINTAYYIVETDDDELAYTATQKYLEENGLKMTYEMGSSWAYDTVNKTIVLADADHPATYALGSNIVSYEPADGAAELEGKIKREAIYYIPGTEVNYPVELPKTWKIKSVSWYSNSANKNAEVTVTNDDSGDNRVVTLSFVSADASADKTNIDKNMDYQWGGMQLVLAKDTSAVEVRFDLGVDESYIMRDGVKITDYPWPVSQMVEKGNTPEALKDKNGNAWTAPTGANAYDSLEFEGWFTDELYARAWKPSAPIPEDYEGSVMTVYAKWKDTLAQGSNSARAVVLDEKSIKTLAVRVDGGSVYGGLWFALDKDLDLGEWTPIGSKYNLEDGFWGKGFKGNFDGRGHTITYTVTNTDAEKKGLGLFSQLHGENGQIIRNLTVAGEINAGGASYVGGIAGFAPKSVTIENCVSKVNIVGAGSYAGGILGKDCTTSEIYNSPITVTKCVNEGSISGANYIGGIVGQGGDMRISFCGNSGTISASAEGGFEGGIAGSYVGYGSNSLKEKFDLHLKNSYSSLTGVDIVGEINSYAPIKKDTLYTVNGGNYSSAYTAEQLASGELAWLLDGGGTDMRYLVWTQGADNKPTFVREDNKALFRLSISDGTKTDISFIHAGEKAAIPVPEGQMIKKIEVLDANGQNVSLIIKTDNSFDMITKDITVNAEYTDAPNEDASYTVTLDPDGGEWSDGALSRTLTANSGNMWRFSEADFGTVTNEGMLLNGWYVVRNGEIAEKFEFNSLVSENLNLRAVWFVSGDVWRVDFNLNGGDGKADPTRLFVEKGGKIDSALITQPKRTSTVENQEWKFIGWSTQKSGGAVWDFESDIVERDITLYAQWKVADPFEPGGSVGAPTISSKSDLYKLIKSVNAGNDYTDVEITLNADLDFTGEKWTPIGTEEHPFSGIFNGNNHTVTLDIKGVEGKYAGMFGKVANAEIKNLAVDGSVDGALYTGAVVGGWEGGDNQTLKLTSCSNNASVKGVFAVGGIVGGSVNYIREDNAAFIIDGCTNNGAVVGDGMTGGIVGYFISSGGNTADQKGKIVNCKNTGSVSLSGKTEFEAPWYIQIDNGSGTTSTVYIGGMAVGGIAGNVSAIGDFKNNENSGDVAAGEGRIAGGIIGAFTQPTGDAYQISDCKNSGHVTGYARVGGAIGSLRGDKVLKNIINVGDITAYNTQSMTGPVVTTSTAGGIVGTSDMNNLDNCYNSGNITYVDSTGNCNVYVGGLGGDMQGKPRQSFESYNRMSYSSGNITVTLPTAIGDKGNHYIGGLFGGLEDASLENMYNSGNITVTGNASKARIAGIAVLTSPYGTETYSSCYTGGKISAPASAKIGGIFYSSERLDRTRYFKDSLLVLADDAGETRESVSYNDSYAITVLPRADFESGKAAWLLDQNLKQSPAVRHNKWTQDAESKMPALGEPQVYKLTLEAELVPNDDANWQNYCRFELADQKLAAGGEVYSVGGGTSVKFSKSAGGYVLSETDTTITRRNFLVQSVSINGAPVDGDEITIPAKDGNVLKAVFTYEDVSEDKPVTPVVPVYPGTGNGNGAGDGNGDGNGAGDGIEDGTGDKPIKPDDNNLPKPDTNGDNKTSTDIVPIINKDANVDNQPVVIAPVKVDTRVENNENTEQPEQKPEEIKPPEGGSSAPEPDDNEPEPEDNKDDKSDAPRELTVFEIVRNTVKDNPIILIGVGVIALLIIFLAGFKRYRSNKKEK